MYVYVYVQTCTHIYVHVYIDKCMHLCGKLLDNCLRRFWQWLQIDVMKYVEGLLTSYFLLNQAKVYLHRNIFKEFFFNADKWELSMYLNI